MLDFLQNHSNLKHFIAVYNPSIGVTAIATINYFDRALLKITEHIKGIKFTVVIINTTTITVTTAITDVHNFNFSSIGYINFLLHIGIPICSSSQFRFYFLKVNHGPDGNAVRKKDR